MRQEDSLYYWLHPTEIRQKVFVKVDAAKGEVWGYNPRIVYTRVGENPAGFMDGLIKVEKQLLPAHIQWKRNRFSGDSIINKKNWTVHLWVSMKKKESGCAYAVGTSFSSLAGADQNLQAEMPGLIW